MKKQKSRKINPRMLAIIFVYGPLVPVVLIVIFNKFFNCQLSLFKWGQNCSIWGYNISFFTSLLVVWVSLLLGAVIVIGPFIEDKYDVHSGDLIDEIDQKNNG